MKSVAPFEEMGKTDFAFAAYKNALQRWPQNRNLLMAAGNASYARGNMAEAENYYRQVIIKWPAYAPALNNLAQVLYEQKNYSEAEKLILKAIKSNSRYNKQYQDTLNNIRDSKHSAKHK